MKNSLSANQLREIQAVLRKHTAISAAVLFGSRALGNFKETSDIDIALKGNVDTAMALTIKDELEEDTCIPLFFDVISYATIENPQLKHHIDEKGVLIYREVVLALEVEF